MIGFGVDKLEAAVELVVVEVLPAAIESEIDGSFCVTKFPKMVMKARTKSGPCITDAGPK